MTQGVVSRLAASFHANQNLPQGQDDTLGSMCMNGIDELLERTCKNMIKTILSCLDNAIKGTIYRIGPMPKLQAMRVTSGIRQEWGDGIKWGLPADSDYNYPGKSWEQYMDQPDHVLEAMGWCVEKQESWTAENPFEDVRSVRKQLLGEPEDYYHMEPVLVKKVDIYGSCSNALEYPLDWHGNPIWQDTEYVVAAVVKIHFVPHTLHREDRSTKIIQELARSLGTELLSLQLRENLYRSQKEFARRRLESCMSLAHELRNTLIKFGFVFSAVNAQIAVLREEWEGLLRRLFPEIEWKDAILDRLSELIYVQMEQPVHREDFSAVCRSLLLEQEEMRNLPLLPEQGVQWLKNKIEAKWETLLGSGNLSDREKQEIGGLLGRLEKSLWLGRDMDLARGVNHLPADLCRRWATLAYIDFTPDKIALLDDIIELLESPELPVPHRKRIGKVLKSLKVLVEVIPEVAEKANRIISSLRYGGAPEMDALAESTENCCACQISPGADETAGVSFVE